MLHVFSGLFHFTLDPYLIMLNVKQGRIKYHFLSLWYDSSGPLANTLTNRPISGRVYIYIYKFVEKEFNFVIPQ